MINMYFYTPLSQKHNSPNFASTKDVNKSSFNLDGTLTLNHVIVTIGSYNKNKFLQFAPTFSSAMLYLFAETMNTQQCNTKEQ